MTKEAQERKREANRLRVHIEQAKRKLATVGQDELPTFRPPKSYVKAETSLPKLGVVAYILEYPGAKLPTWDEGEALYEYRVLEGDAEHGLAAEQREREKREREAGHECEVGREGAVPPEAQLDEAA